MARVLSRPYFHDEEAAYAKMESIVWRNGPICPHCGDTERIGKLKGAATRIGVHTCYACRKQFRVTINTVFESAHVKLHQWLQAAYLLASSKKRCSIKQITRAFGVTVKTSWFVTHRLREAMAISGNLSQIGGEGEIVEIDETLVGQKEGAPIRCGYAHKHAAISLVERGAAGAQVRSFQASGTAAADLLSVIRAHFSSGTHVITDEVGQYADLGTSFIEHDFVRHSAGGYGRGNVSANSVEVFDSVFKRGMVGVYQHCGGRHLCRHVPEFDFRYNNPARFRFYDEKRTNRIPRGIIGEGLTYRDLSGASA